MYDDVKKDLAGTIYHQDPNICVLDSPDEAAWHRPGRDSMLFTNVKHPDFQHLFRPLTPASRVQDGMMSEQNHHTHIDQTAEPTR